MDSKGNTQWKNGGAETNTVREIDPAGVKRDEPGSLRREERDGSSLWRRRAVGRDQLGFTSTEGIRVP